MRELLAVTEDDDVNLTRELVDLMDLKADDRFVIDKQVHQVEVIDDRMAPNDRDSLRLKDPKTGMLWSVPVEAVFRSWLGGDVEVLD